jgi:hypothetical protein
VPRPAFRLKAEATLNICHARHERSSSFSGERFVGLIGRAPNGWRFRAVAARPRTRYGVDAAGLTSALFAALPIRRIEAIEALQSESR